MTGILARADRDRASCHPGDLARDSEPLSAPASASKLWKICIETPTSEKGCA